MSVLSLGTLVMMSDIGLAWTPLDSDPNSACRGGAGLQAASPSPGRDHRSNKLLDRDHFSRHRPQSPSQGML